MRTKIIALLACLMVCAAAVNAADVTYGGHEITFFGVSEGEDGSCTWRYYVCSGEKPALSHWVLESCVGYNESVNWTTDPQLNGSIEFGRDPHTDITGIKFDVGMEDGQCATFYFTTSECRGIEVLTGLKAGKDVYIGQTITGPLFYAGECVVPTTSTTTSTTTTTTTTTSKPTTTTTIINAAEFSSEGIAPLLLFLAPALAYLILRRKE